MDDIFNPKTFTENALFLIRQKNLRIGQVEADAGVSPGFLSKLTKEGASKPSIEFAMRVAKILDTNLDLLLTADLSDMGPSEHYILRFLSALTESTAAGEHTWTARTRHQLADVKILEGGRPSHPLFSTRVVSEGEDGVSYAPPAFTSHSFGENTAIADTCYDVEMPFKARLYLMAIGEKIPADGSARNAIEVWMAGNKFLPEYFCSSQSSPAIGNALKKLYEAVALDIRRPKIGKNIKAITDAYLGIDDEDEDALPFN